MNINKEKIIKEFKLNWKSALVVAIVNIPLSISLAIASWATPVQWLITAIWAWTIASIFASSRHNIFWPAWALAWILLWASITFWPEYLSLIAIISWIIMLLVYSLKLTRYITLIPAAWLQWFLFSVWIWIFASQLSWWFWLFTLKASEKVYLTIWDVIINISNLDLLSTWIFFAWLAFLFFFKHKVPKIPWAIALSLIWIIIWILSKNWYFPELFLLSDKYPTLSFNIYANVHTIWLYKSLLQNPKLILDLTTLSWVIAIITILETIVSWKVAEKMTKNKFRKNKEILWNALANIGSWIMWWLPATAVLVRTALNIKNWATSKYSAFMAWIMTLLISLIFFNSLFKYLPIPIISSILIFIAIWIMDFHVLKKFYKLKKTSFYIILITIFFSVIEDNVVWLLIWTLISMLVFLKRVTNSKLNITVFRNKEFYAKMPLSRYIWEQKKQDTIIIKLVWEINYLNIDSYLKEIEKIEESEIIIFSFSQLSDIDIDWMELIEEVIENFKNKEKNIYISWLKEEWVKQLCLRIPVIKELKNEWKMYDSTSQLLDKLG